MGNDKTKRGNNWSNAGKPSKGGNGNPSWKKNWGTTIPAPKLLALLDGVRGLAVLATPPGFPHTPSNDGADPYNGTVV